MSRNNELRRSMLDELLIGQPARKKQKTTLTSPISTLMLDGQRACEEDRFKDAIRHFTHAIDNLTDRNADLLHVYSLRSRAYIHTNDYDLALKDAKQMIRLDRSDARGYIKCAQIEQLKGNLQAAMRACEYGLKSIPVSTTGYAKLETSLARLNEATKQRVVFERGTDPMDVLPTELLDMVIATFDYRQIVAIMRVCKKWRSRLRSSDIILQTIDTRQAKKTITYLQLKAAFSSLGKTPRLIALAKLNESASRFASSELGHWIRWESLESLVLEDGKLHLSRIRWEKLQQLKTFRIGQGLSVPEDIGGLLRKCAALQSLHLHGTMTNQLDYCLLHCPSEVSQHLRDLVVHPAQTSKTQIRFPQHCLFPGLKRLELGNICVNSDLDLTSYTHLKVLKLANAPVDDRYNLRTPAQLEKFTLEGPFPNVFPRPEEIKMPAGILHTISVKGTDSIRFLAYALRQGLDKKVFRHLSIADFVVHTNVAGRHVVSDLQLLKDMSSSEAFENVETLVLRDDNIRDQAVNLILTLFPKTQHLDVEAPYISEVFVTDYVKARGGDLRSITLRNCSGIADDVVRWCEARGVELNLVRRSWQDDAFGGHRVRYA